MKENVSAWMDGELPDAQGAQLLPQLKSSVELRKSWDCYHLIGDALRGIHGADLCAELRARIASEPTVLAPQRARPLERLRQNALAVAASVAAVAFVGWVGLSGLQDAAPQLAATPVAAPVPEIRQASAGMKDYLLAHQRYSPSSAMQGVAPYVRTVAEERSAPRR